MTQAKLGKKLGVSQVTVSNWEKNKTAATVEQKDGIKRILGNFWTANVAGQADPQEISGPGPIASWVTKARLSKDLSVAELAESAGLSVAGVYNIEAGRISNPRQETIVRLEKALKDKVPNEAKAEVKDEATIQGMGELVEFDPHDNQDLPASAGIYVLYDVSERPIYVGQGQNIGNRISNHVDKFWFKRPIVETAAYVEIQEKPLREKVEKLLIRFLKSNAVINKQFVDR